MEWLYDFRQGRERREGTRCSAGDLRSLFWGHGMERYLEVYLDGRPFERNVVALCPDAALVYRKDGIGLIICHDNDKSCCCPREEIVELGRAGIHGALEIVRGDFTIRRPPRPLVTNV